LIHSSLPASERVAVVDDEGLRLRPIGEVVAKGLSGHVVSFDPETFEVGYHPITGWYEGPADRIFEVCFASGRSVRVTAGHALFTLDRDGNLVKVRAGELRAGTRVAIPRRVPAPPSPRPSLDIFKLAPEAARRELMLEGPTVDHLLDNAAADAARLLKEQGWSHISYFRSRRRLPLQIAMQLCPTCPTSLDRLAVKGSSQTLPISIDIDNELAWLFGMYVAEGSHRRGQVTVSNTDQALLDRLQRIFEGLGLPVYRSAGAVTCCSTLLAEAFDWLCMGDTATEKRMPSAFLGWPDSLLEAFLEGFVDGDGSREVTRVSLWSSSDGLVDDLLYLCERLGRRASASVRVRDGRRLYQVSIPRKEHKMLTAVPLPDRLLIRVREETLIPQVDAAKRAGYRHASDLNNIERRRGRDAVRRRTLARLHAVYRSADRPAPSLPKLERLIDGDLLWDTVTSVRDTGVSEPIYDLEVRPGGRHIENFLAGTGGVFVSNTAGFVDAGWDGHLTLELSNVANLPITLYPGMKIGQISFLRMTTPADQPYGSKGVGSKYQGQRGPTPSRYFENFRDR
jgi:dCTP deaminase